MASMTTERMYEIPVITADFHAKRRPEDPLMEGSCLACRYAAELMEMAAEIPTINPEMPAKSVELVTPRNPARTPVISTIAPANPSATEPMYLMIVSWI